VSSNEAVFKKMYFYLAVVGVLPLQQVMLATGAEVKAADLKDSA